MAEIATKKKEEPTDLGFGTKAYARTRRLLNPDGSFNVIRKGLPRWKNNETYHRLITMSWARFNLLVLSYFIVVNLFFACIYWWLGVGELGGLIEGGPGRRFLEDFFFSAQTLTTVGYGRISPIGTEASIVAAIESMVGLLGFALATGLLYGRFSRPVAHLIFSKNAVMAPYRGITGFMFRLANARSNQLIEAEVSVIVSMIKDDGKNRTFDTVKLERSKINFVSLSWTIVHPVDEESPLFNMAPAELEKRDAEFIILFKAFDDTFCQTLYSRSSYKFHDIEWDAKFSGMIGEVGEDGKVPLYLDKIDAFDKVK